VAVERELLYGPDTGTEGAVDAEGATPEETVVEAAEAAAAEEAATSDTATAEAATAESDAAPGAPETQVAAPPQEEPAPDAE
jgi:hypothetical protein